MKKSFLIMGLFFIFMLTASGCVRRIVSIDSVPKGAQVYFDRKPIGETPCTHKFEYYGVHYLELVKDGYANFSTTVKLKGPLYEYFPFSIFSELFLPSQIINKHSFTFTLEEGQTRKPIISPIEEPQPALPALRLEHIGEKQQ